MAIIIENVSYTYDDGREALKDISVHFEKGKKTAIVGLNGSGKSTLLYHLNGVFLPQKGRVKVFGRDVSKDRLNEIRKQVGFLFDYPDHQLFLTTVYEDIGFGLRNLGYSSDEVNLKVDNILKKLNIEHLKDFSPYQLSLGQKKICAIAGVLVMDPEVIVCDEPFSGLDVNVTEIFKSILDDFSSAGKTIIVSTHDQEYTYEWADNVLVMKEGRIIDYGDTVSIFNKSDMLKDAGVAIPKLAQLFGSKSPAPRTVEEVIKYAYI